MIEAGGVDGAQVSALAGAATDAAAMVGSAAVGSAVGAA